MNRINEKKCINKESTYDEKEQERLFREAVNEFRGVKDNVSSEFATGTDPITSNLLPVNKERKCCWNCMKVILTENALEHYFEEKIMKYKVVNNCKIKLLVLLF